MALSPSDVIRSMQTLAGAGRHGELIAFAESNMPVVQAHDETAFRLATSYAQSDRLADAEALLKAILARSPHLTNVKAAMCKVCILLKKSTETEALFRALEIDASKHPPFNGLLGDAYLQAGRAEDALRAFTRFRNAGGSVSADIGLAECQFRLGRIDEAAALARRVAARSGLDSSTLPIALATSLCADDNRLFSNALAAINRMPDTQAGAVYGLCADVLIAGGRLREAIFPSEKRAQLSQRPEDWLLLADLQLAAPDLAGAEASTDEARRLDPQSAGALTMLARCQILRGDLQAGKNLLRQAIARDANAVTAYDHLSQLDPAAIDAAMRSHLESIAQSPTITESDRPKLLLALGRAFEHSGALARAFELYFAANAILAAEAKLAGRGYDKGATETALHTMKRSFTTASAKLLSSSSNIDQTPIFIIGMPRSGTTLLEQILSSHSQVSGGGELPGMIDICNEFARRTMTDKEAGDYLAAHAVSLAERYIASLPQTLRRAAWFTDKHPLNFWSVGAIKALFPNAPIIHLLRDPADTCLSIFKLRFYREYAFANDLDSIAHYYAAYESLMQHWRSIHPGGFLEMRYETLTADFEGRAREMIAYCGLDWEDGCLDFHKTPRPVLTHSAAQVRSPINSRAIGSARKFAEQLKPFEDALIKYRAAFGTNSRC